MTNQGATITGLRFADAELDVNQTRCRYSTRDGKAEVSVSVGAADLGIVRSKETGL